MATTTIHVEGMSCSHCENAVKSALSELNGVKDVIVSLAEKSVQVTYEADAVSADTLKETITDVGYEVK